jgi:osmotically-inducible protein OsmY
LIGGPDRTAALRRELATLRIPIVEDAASGGAGVEDAPHPAGAIVLAPTLLPGPAVRLVRALREAHPATPLFVAAVRGTTDAQAAPLYRAGAAGVFAWPDEAPALRETLRELLGGAAPRTAPSATDRALEREIRTRLRASGMSGRAAPGLRVRVREGVASIAGPVERLWRKRRVDLLVSQIPGIRAVDLRGVEVRSSGLRDREIARSLRALLRGASSIEDRTLAVQVHDGHAVVKGAVTSWEEWEHARDLIALTTGVRSVTDQTVTSPRRKRSDRDAARRLKAALCTLLPDSEGIRPAVLGPIVVLRGNAPRLATRREAERVVRRDPAVARVVNKIEVTPPG